VAEELLGAIVRRDDVALRITEVEAYRWPDDSACHGRHGITPRNRTLWGPPGRAYLYLCYGIHHLLNFVTGRDGEAAAVLIRACEPLEGLETVARRRGGKRGPVLLTGPGKVAQALGLDLGWDGHLLYKAGGLDVRRGDAPSRVVRGRRIGVGYARTEHLEAPWRLADGDSTWVSHRKDLA